MKVEFKTPFAEMTFEMGQPQAVALLRQALEYASFTRSPEPTATPLERPADVPAAPVEPEPAATHKGAARGSRVENMFGSRESWEGRNKKANDRNERKYRGFLYIRCEKCGQEKGFNAKYLLSCYKCACGHNTELEDLLPVNVFCECGKKFRYMTNVQDNEFTMNCLECGTPNDLIMTGRRDGFVTFASLNR